ncbi:MAG: DUF5615 family PIN-like protein [Candidatus Lokiarchaeota archaeon]|nr:DUF5615 family PIN-like protein [Candidatus Lokiarchaeota archaeon]
MVIQFKFLIDAMLGRLARFLRIFGYDTVYANDLEKEFDIYSISDDKLIEYAKKTNRILITKDLPLYKRFNEQSFFLEGKDVYGYLRQLKSKFNITFKIDIGKAHCSRCNARLKKILDKNLIKDQLKDDTFKYYNNFYQCLNSNCKKIFWNGSHIKNIEKKLNEI